MTPYLHTPVMLGEVLSFLNIKSSGKYIDCTLGGAGYTLAIARQLGVKGEVLSLDLDDNALDHARLLIKKLKINNIVLKRSNFINLKSVVQKIWSDKTLVDGIVLDLGLSSFQLDDEARGFSFKSKQSLDMAFGPDILTRTVDIVNKYSVEKLTKIFRDYGEDKRAYYLARAIEDARSLQPIVNAWELAQLVESKVPMRYRGKIHPATKIFQALRMETNQELENLVHVLPAATELLSPGGRLVVVSFHSGEDRIVKRYFKNSTELKIITKRPLVAKESEIKNNPRSRSAKFRVAEKI